MYSQHGEDSIILSFFSKFENKNLNFLDIGANDGVTFSNTWDLALIGWGGCCIEPSKQAFQILHDNYSKNSSVYLFNYGISDREDTLKFYESRNWIDKDYTPISILSSLHEEHKNRFYGMIWEETECSFVRFSTFLEESPIKKFDFISIDVEGHEVVILQQINLKEIGCKLICLEYSQNNDYLEFFIEYCKKYEMIEIYRSIDNVIFAIKDLD